MGLPPDSASLIMLEIGKELRFYEDTLATIGLLYVGKLTISFASSLYRGFKEHILTKVHPNKELIFSYGNWAMVTGATEGMGKAFAEELARRGLNIVLLDGDLSKLNDISAEIGEVFHFEARSKIGAIGYSFRATNFKAVCVFAEQETGVDTRIVEVDFFDEFVINENLVEVIKSVEIGILINAFQTVIQTPTPFTKISAEEINTLLNANVKSLTMITYVILTGMLHRNKGLILNLSAFSGLYPVPFISIYSASKAYTEFFSQSLSMECRGTEVVVQTVAPGFIKMQEAQDDSIMSYIVPTMNNFVRNTVDSLAVSTRITGSWRFSLELWLLKRVPECIMQILVFELMNSACR